MNRDLLLAVLRSTRLLPFIVGGLLGTAIILVPICFQIRLDLLDTTVTLHLAMVGLVVGSGFVLDDPARAMLAALPLAPWRVAVLRMAVGALVLMVFWAVYLALLPFLVESAAPYPRSGLVVEALAVAAWGWAVAWTVGGSRAGGDGSVVAGPALFFACLVISMLPDRIALFVTPGGPEYPASRWRWYGALLTGVVALAVSLARSGSAGWRLWGRPARRTTARRVSAGGDGRPRTRGRRRTPRTPRS